MIENNYKQYINMYDFRISGRKKALGRKTMGGFDATTHVMLFNTPMARDPANVYCQEWEIDQLLQFCRCNFVFLSFAWFLKAKYLTKIWPS